MGERVQVERHAVPSRGEPHGQGRDIVLAPAQAVSTAPVPVQRNGCTWLATGPTMNESFV